VRVARAATEDHAKEPRVWSAVSCGVSGRVVVSIVRLVLLGRAAGATSDEGMIGIRDAQFW